MSDTKLDFIIMVGCAIIFGLMLFALIRHTSLPPPPQDDKFEPVKWNDRVLLDHNDTCERWNAEVAALTWKLEITTNALHAIAQDSYATNVGSIHKAIDALAEIDGKK